MTTCLSVLSLTPWAGMVSVHHLLHVTVLSCVPTGAPTGPGADQEDYNYWQLHALYYPPLLRSATVSWQLVKHTYK